MVSSTLPVRHRFFDVRMARNGDGDFAEFAMRCSDRGGYVYPMEDVRDDSGAATSTEIPEHATLAEVTKSTPLQTNTSAPCATGPGVKDGAGMDRSSFPVQAQPAQNSIASVQQTATQAPKVTVPFRFLNLPPELQNLVMKNVHTLSDAIALALPLVNAGCYGLMVGLLDNVRDELLLNDEFIKAVFDSQELYGEYRTPKDLGPDQSNPRGLTYERLIKQTKRNSDAAALQDLRCEYHKALVKFRHGCLFRSKEYRKGTDRPKWLVKQHFEWSYGDLVELAKKDNETATQRYLEKQRDVAQIKEMNNKNKTKRLLTILTKVLLDPKYLPTTCRTCGSAEAYNLHRLTLPRCRHCLETCAEDIMVSCKELKTYGIDVDDYAGQSAEPWIRPVKIGKLGAFVSRIEANILCKLYHNAELSTIRLMAQSGGDSWKVVINKGLAAYRRGAVVADAVRQQCSKNRASFRFRNLVDGVSFTDVSPDNLDAELITLIAERTELRPDSPNHWARVVSLTEEVYCEVFDMGEEPSQAWYASMTALFWADLLLNKLQRVTLKDVFEQYHVVRINGFRHLADGTEDALNEQTMTINELQELCRTVQQCSLPEAAELHPAEAEIRLSRHVLHCAAILDTARLYPDEMMEAYMDLIALTTNDRGLPLDDAKDRFRVFFDYTHSFFNNEFTKGQIVGTYNKLADVPEHLLQVLESCFNNQDHHDRVYSSLRRLANGRQMYLLLQRATSDLPLQTRPEIFRAARDHVHFIDCSEGQPLPTVSGRCGRIAWCDLPDPMLLD
ncbi:hypothetical protein LTR85_003578 [Meristemomyces frigidus]|nr:hypothetical protein LTR85_003578 [Meristemomyces frigidus]